METDPQHMLSAHIPWYRTRWFWGGVFVLLLFFSLFLYLQFSAKNGGDHQLSIDQNLNFIYASTGALLFKLIGFKIAAIIGGHLFAIFYYLLQVWLLYKTFSTIQIRVAYPASLLLLYTLGIIAAVAFLPGL